MSTPTRIEELAQLYSDLHKDAYGFRPRNFAMTEAELEAAIARIDAEMPSILEEEREQERRAAERFEALVTATIATGAGDRATAIRWLHDAAGTSGDNDYLCYHHGLAYGYLDAPKGAAA